MILSIKSDSIFKGGGFKGFLIKVIGKSNLNLESMCRGAVSKNKGLTFCERGFFDIPVVLF